MSSIPSYLIVSITDNVMRMLQICSQLGGSSQNPLIGWLSVALFLVVNGADLDHRNHANRSPLDDIDNDQIRDLLIKNKLVSPTAYCMNESRCTSPI